MKLTETTLSRIQVQHGCCACKHREDDEWLADNQRFWCSKLGQTMTMPNAVPDAASCTDWQLITDKDKRGALIGEAQQRPLPL